MSLRATNALIVTAVLGGVLLLCLLIGGIVLMYMYYDSGVRDSDAIKPGMARGEVIDLAGEPYRAYTAAQAPGNYPAKDSLDPERPITGEVLIYDRGEWQIYIFLDPAGKVEETVVKGT